MPHIAICYASADAPLARDLATYLATNLEHPIDHLLAGQPLDLLDALESAAEAGLPVAVLSPASVPERWSRERWQPFLDSRAAWALAGDCPFPPLLRRGHFFDCRGEPLSAFRAMRMWIDECRGGSGLEPDAAGIVDAPGRYQTAHGACSEHARRCFREFVTIDARGRTALSMKAELARALGVAPSGNPAELTAGIRAALSRQRRLLIFEGGTTALLDCLGDPGRASILAVTGVQPPPSVEPAAIVAALRECGRGRSQPPSDADLDRALAQATAPPELAQIAFSYFKTEFRLAEAHELADARERAWIEECWSSREQSGHLLF